MNRMLQAKRLLRPRRLLPTLGLAVLVGLAPLGQASLAHAQAGPPETLLEFWLQWQRTVPSSPAWGYAFASQEQPDRSFTERRLLAELGGLADALRLSSRQELASAAMLWQQALRDTPARRTPGRVDPAWLAANPRQVPPLTALERIGVCQPPAWVEVWSLAGVDRVAWHNGMTSSEVIATLPSRPRRAHVSAVLISPLGEPGSLGIAPWNHEQRPVAPGSRLWLNVPHDLAPGQGTVLRWLNQAMPEALAARLPGEACTTLWSDVAAGIESHP